MKTFLSLFGLELVLIFITTTIIWYGVNVKKKIFKHFAFNFSAILIAILIYEVVLTINTKSSDPIHYSSPYYIHKPELGYGVPDSTFNIRATKQRKTSGDTIYDVTYSLSSGRRVTPNSNNFSTKYKLFLGGSFTFGEGLNDSETLPFYFNKSASDSFNIRNYGFHGYGTHQVHTIVKNQILKDTSFINSEGVDVYYWFINAHIFRANGYSAWDEDGPYYTLNNGMLRHSGSFREKHNSIFKKLSNIIWRRSAIYNSVLRSRLATGDGEVALFLALVKDTHQMLKESGFNFTVLLQDRNNSGGLFSNHQAGVMNKIRLYFDSHHINYINVNDAFQKDFSTTDSLIIADDGHPSKAFNKILGSYLRNQELLK